MGASGVDFTTGFSKFLTWPCLPQRRRPVGTVCRNAYRRRPVGVAPTTCRCAQPPRPRHSRPREARLKPASRLAKNQTGHVRSSATTTAKFSPPTPPRPGCLTSPDCTMLSKAREWYSGSTSASQAEDGGSIPLSRSKVPQLEFHRIYFCSAFARVDQSRRNVPQ